MPTYEYRCANGHEFERFQRMSEPPVDTCPTCGAAAERLLSAGGLLFKGSGFYITDYRTDSYRKAAEAESGGGKAGADKGGADKGGTDKGGTDKGGTDKGGGTKTSESKGGSAGSGGSTSTRGE